MYRAYVDGNISEGEQDMIVALLRKGQQEGKANKAMSLLTEMGSSKSGFIGADTYFYTGGMDSDFSESFYYFAEISENTLRKHAQELLESSTGIRNIVSANR